MGERAMKFSRYLTKLPVVMAAFTLPAAAQAATVNVSQSVDLGQVYNFGNFISIDGSVFDPATDVTISVGDTLNFQVDFLGNQQMRIDGFSFAFPALYMEGVNGGLYVRTAATGSFSFLDTDGNVVLTSNVTDTRSCCAPQFNQPFFDYDFPNLPSTITFGGIRYSAVLDAYLSLYSEDVEPTATSRRYDGSGLYLSGSQITVLGLGGAAVPEPASWAMMITGFGFAGAAIRRQKAALRFA
jgi:hypothetical protein